MNNNLNLKPISSLIDPRTRIAKTMTSTGPRSCTFSGYLAFVVSGELVQRRVYDMPYNHQFDSCMYIIHKKANYAIDLACKPISGAFNVQSLKV